MNVTDALKLAGECNWEGIIVVGLGKDGVMKAISSDLPNATAVCLLEEMKMGIAISAQKPKLDA